MTSPTERTLPHSLDAERALLGAVLLKASTWPVVSSLVRDADFFRDAHGRIYRAMQHLADEQAPIDYLALKEELRRSGDLDEVGGPAYLASLTDGVPVAKEKAIEHYARIVCEKARLRSLILHANALLGQAFEAEAPAAVIVDAAMGKFLSIIGTTDRRVVSAHDAIRTYVSSINSGEYGQSVMTGYTDVDDLIGGFKTSDLVILGARPSVGKSAWALGAAEAMALAGTVVLFFSLEMGLEGLSARLLAGRSRVSSTAIERGTALPEEYARWADASGMFDGLPLHFQSSIQTLSEIAGWSRRVQQEQGLGCVFVDYLQMLVPENSRHQQEAAIAAISKGLKMLAKELRVPVVALSQLSRAPEGRTDKRPHLSDLRSSGALEQDCDLAILLYRPSMHGRTPENDGIAEVIVAKNRTGSTGVVRMCFIESLARFENLAPQYMA